MIMIMIIIKKEFFHFFSYGFDILAELDKLNEF